MGIECNFGEMDVSAWVDEQTTALNLERDEELMKTPTAMGITFETYQGDKGLVSTMQQSPAFPLRVLQLAGMAVKGLEITESGVLGAGRSSTIHLAKASEESLRAEASCFRARDIVVLLDSKLRLLVRGILTRVAEKSLTVALDDTVDPDYLDSFAPFILLRAGSDATYRYNIFTMQTLASGKTPWGDPLAGAMATVRPRLLGIFWQSLTLYRQNRGLLEDGAQPHCSLETSTPFLPDHPGYSLEDLQRDMSLNQYQLAGVKNIVSSRTMSLTWGPPGTGKTTTISAAIAYYLLAYPDRRVFACAPSNVAADNLLLGAVHAMQKIGLKDVCTLRLGSPARATSALVEEYLVDAMVDRLCSSEIGSAKTDLERARQAYERARRQMRATGDRRGMIEARNAMRGCQKTYSAAQSNGIQTVVVAPRLVVATLSTAAGRMSQRVAQATQGYDLVIVDEASQALDVSLMAALLLAKGPVALAGDPKQLPPTILNDENARRTAFCAPLMMRLVAFLEHASAITEKNPDHCAVLTDLFKSVGVAMLEEQYRFSSRINKYPSETFYLSRLRASSTCSAISMAGVLGDAWLSELGDALDDRDPSIIFVDTAGCNMFETAGGGSAEKAGPGTGTAKGAGACLESLSTLNASEVRLVATIARYLQWKAGQGRARYGAEKQVSKSKAKKQAKRSLQAKTEQPAISTASIGIIAPYSAQVSALAAELDDLAGQGLEISTVDGFQGREKEAIIISFVRSNERKEVGFLGDYRRLNVSITRCKRLLVLVGDSETLEEDGVMGDYMNFVMSNAFLMTPDDVETLRGAMEGQKV